jgi:hypothetical protein
LQKVARFEATLLDVDNSSLLVTTMPRQLVPVGDIGRKFGAAALFGRILLDTQQWDQKPHEAKFSFAYELASQSTQSTVELAISVVYDVRHGDISAPRVDVCQRNLT